MAIRKWLLPALVLLPMLQAVSAPVAAQPDPPRAAVPVAELDKSTEREVPRLSERVRDGLKRLSITSVVVQDAVVAKAVADLRAAVPLKARFTLLRRALEDLDTPDDRIAALQTDFLLALEAEKSRRDAALGQLDAATGYSKNPRLEIILTLLGLMGDEDGILRAVPQSLHRLFQPSLLRAMEGLHVPQEARGAITQYVSEQELKIEGPTAVGWWLQSISRDLKAPEETPDLVAPLAFFRQTMREYVKREEADLAKLEDAIHFSRSPRLKASLLLLGLTNHSTSLLNIDAFYGVTISLRSSNVVTGESPAPEQLTRIIDTLRKLRAQENYNQP